MRFRPSIHWRVFLCATLCLLLGGCRLLFQLEGSGVLLSEASGAIYRDGDEIDVTGAFSDSFRPVPMPGHSFVRWGAVCKKQNNACLINVSEDAAQLEVDGKLEPVFASEYSGPLRLATGEFLDELPTGDFLRIPDGSLEIEGQRTSNSDLRLFLATVDLSFIVAGERNGGGVDFNLPEGAPGFENLYLFISAFDANNVLASVGTDLQAVPAADAASLRAYRQGSPFSENIAGCVSAASVFELCDFETLPTLGMETDVPTLEQVLQRTVVSHDWMGERFIQFMQQMPDDVYRMMRGVTAVVIGANVRPAYYFPPTGAIHLDPAFLWLSNAEKATISKDEDFRQAFADKLDFLFFGDYFSGNDFAYGFASLDDNLSRSLSEAMVPFAALMFHELAHANDFSPPSRTVFSSPQDTMLDAIARNEPYFATTVLEADLPLGSTLLRDLAAVRWGGAEPTTAQRNVSAQQAGAIFGGEGATSLYAYFLGYEDTATLAEAALLNYHFGVDMGATFIEQLTRDPVSCADYVVGWGQRNRLGIAEVAARAELVLQHLLDETDTRRYTARSVAVENMTAGVGYCTSLRNSRVSTSVAGAPSRQLPGRVPIPRELIRVPVRPPLR